MVKIDLITGFLGSGKTTFLKKYASHLLERGSRIGILENDFGAVNVDMMLLLDLEGDNCELEMISGGCDADCHKRRFKTKLIAFGMSGLDRVIVEPSGIYDVEEFFDTLREEPLSQWYEIGSVIAVVDAKPEKNLTEEAGRILAAQIAAAGRVVLSRSQYASSEEISETVLRLNEILMKYGCRRKRQEQIVCRDWESLTAEDFDEIADGGYDPDDCMAAPVDKENVFTSLYFMNVCMTEEEIHLAVRKIFEDPACGQVLRIKGFMPGAEGGWLEINATSGQTVIGQRQAGQEILIVIGEALNENAIRSYLMKEH